jgi:hypothetical protein
MAELKVTYTEEELEDLTEDLLNVIVLDFEIGVDEKESLANIKTVVKDFLRNVEVVCE